MVVMIEDKNLARAMIRGNIYVLSVPPLYNNHTVVSNVYDQHYILGAICDPAKYQTSGSVRPEPILYIFFVLPTTRFGSHYPSEFDRLD